MSIKTALRSLSLVLAAAPFILAAQPAAAQDSQCISCHTSGGKLIKITRGLAKYKKAPEVESKGPG